MDQYKTSETRKIAATSTAKTEDFVRSCRGAVVSADADCFIAFDEVADSGSLFIQADTNTGYIFLTDVVVDLNN